MLEEEARFLADGCTGCTAADFQGDERLASAMHVLTLLREHLSRCAPLAYAIT